MTTPRTLTVLQLLGLFVAPAAWFGQHLIGQAVAAASCSAADVSWGVDNRAWQIALLAGAGVLILVSEAAAIAAFRATRRSDYQSPPPGGRVQLIAVAAMTTNLLYLVIVLLDGIASILDATCRNA